MDNLIAKNDATIFAKMLRKAKLPNNEICFGNFRLPVKKGVKDEIQYNQQGLDLLREKHQYTAKIADGDLQISLQLYLNEMDHYRLFAYTRINDVEGMTFTINLTTQKESENVIFLTRACP